MVELTELRVGPRLIVPAGACEEHKNTSRGLDWFTSLGVRGQLAAGVTMGESEVAEFLIGGGLHETESLILPSAVLTIWLCNGVSQFALIVGTDPLHEFRRGEHTSGFYDGPFAMHPLGLNGIEPGTLAG